MNKRCIFSIAMVLTAAFAMTASASITTTYSNVGSNNFISNVENWSSGLPVGQQGGISTDAGFDSNGTLENYDIVHSAGTVSRAAGLSGLRLGAGSTWLANGTAAYSSFRGLLVTAGGSYTQGAGVDGDFTNNNRDSTSSGAGASIVINGGTFGVGRDLILSAGGSFTVNAGTVSVGDGLYTQSFSTSAGPINFNGGTTTANNIDFDKNGLLTFGGTTAGSLTIATTYSVLSAATVSFDWLTGTKMAATITGEDEWAAAEWAAGNLTYNGADYTTLGDWAAVTSAGGLGGGANFSYDSGTETLTVIPEPAVMGLVCISGLGFIMLRRLVM